MVEDKLIISFLKKHPKQLFSPKEVAEELERMTERGIKSMQSQMKKMVKEGSINADKINRMLASKLYGKNYKRGLTLYYHEPEQ